MCSMGVSVYIENLYILLMPGLLLDQLGQTF